MNSSNETDNQILKNRTCTFKLWLGICLIIDIMIYQRILISLLFFSLQIKMSFMPVGHTHEDIDQFFSRISAFLRKQDVQLLQKLLALVPKAYKKLITTAEQLVGVFDVRKWFDGHLSEMNSHSYPHVFKFTKCAGEWIFIRCGISAVQYLMLLQSGHN